MRKRGGVQLGYNCGDEETSGLLSFFGHCRYVSETQTKIGVVLAGGRSTRMGRDKALLDWHGVTLLDHICRLLREAGVDRIVVSGERAGYDCIPDAEPDRGPGYALTGVLAALPADTSALIVPVDMPLLTPTLLRNLLMHAAACYEGHPLPAVLPSRTADGDLLRADSIKALHLTAGSVSLPVPPGEAARLVNTNTPEEWLGIQSEPAP
jgi:molybdopterin-guanine dinucleotide biosynthesis protein A